MWPNFATPQARDFRTGGADRWGDPARSRNLNDQVAAMWPTPRTKGMCGGTGAWEKLNDATTHEEAKLMGAGNGGQLNPDWVELLMGWPLGWTRTVGSRPDMDGWQGAHAGGVPWGEGTAWERGVPRVAAKIPNRVGRLKCIGNGQVPAAMRLAWESLRNNRRDIHEML